jgi:glutamate dehydrogenase (NAD(P)+)
VRFGRMEKRFEEMSAGRMVKSIESATGKNLSDTEKKLLVRGADEEDLVNSGLEETMSVAYQQIMAVQRKNNSPDFRTSALITAIDKIAVSYMELGIFP